MSLRDDSVFRCARSRLLLFHLCQAFLSKKYCKNSHRFEIDFVHYPLRKSPQRPHSPHPTPQIDKPLPPESRRRSEQSTLCCILFLPPLCIARRLFVDPSENAKTHSWPHLMAPLHLSRHETPAPHPAPLFLPHRLERYNLPHHIPTLSGHLYPTNCSVRLDTLQKPKKQEKNTTPTSSTQPSHRSLCLVTALSRDSNVSTTSGTDMTTLFRLARG